MDKVELGDRVKDKISGLKGIVTSTTDWLYGCRRIAVQPEEHKDGKPVETFVVDEPQLIVTKKGAIKSQAAPAEKPKTRHGGRPDVGMRRADPTR